jgi:hypothetical protein
VAPEVSSLELLRPILTELITARIGVPRTVAEELNALLNNAEIKVRSKKCTKKKSFAKNFCETVIEGDKHSTMLNYFVL